eukprot:4183132-Prymnesium_polylepis.1
MERNGSLASPHPHHSVIASRGSERMRSMRRCAACACGPLRVADAVAASPRSAPRPSHVSRLRLSLRLSG